MKIIKEVYDFNKGDKFLMNSGVEFEVVVSNKDKKRFLAIVAEAENEDDIGKTAYDFNFDGLNIKRSEDFIKSATDENGKEYKLERKENNEITVNDLEKSIEILMKMNKINENKFELNKELAKEAYEMSKKMTLKALKNDRWTLEQKKEVIERFKAVKESYKEYLDTTQEDELEIENMINELEEE